jgi:hypothetical protein
LFEIYFYFVSLLSLAAYESSSSFPQHLLQTYIPHWNTRPHELTDKLRHKLKGQSLRLVWGSDPDNVTLVLRLEAWKGRGKTSPSFGEEEGLGDPGVAGQRGPGLKREGASEEGTTRRASWKRC